MSKALPLGFNVSVVLDSINPCGIRLTTMSLTFPREILAEFNTHRVLSRSAMSSRAVPVARILQQVEESPYVPMHWGAAQPGMQADNQIPAGRIPEAAAEWLKARDAAVEAARRMLALGLHKQVVNRLLEPFSWVKVVVTSTKWANLFALRTDRAAHPAFRRVARAAWQVMRASTPLVLDYGQWHLPYLRRDEAARATSLHTTASSLTKLIDPSEPPEAYGEIEFWRRVSAARCARVSYNNHEGVATTADDDLGLYARMAASTPRHASPLEHQGTPFIEVPAYMAGNLHGWVQYRKMVRHECADTFSPSDADIEEWKAAGDWLDDDALAEAIGPS